MSFLAIRQVCKSFGGLTVVNDVSLEVARGEFFALLGPSGCGKTTLLRMIAGFETPDSGTITIDGEAMNTVPPHLRPTNMVFQSYAIFPHLNVFDNIAYGLRKQRLPREALRARVEAMLATVRLEGLGGARGRSAVRRPAPARGAGARPDTRAQAAAAGRTAGGAGQAPARSHAGGTARHPAPGRHHLPSGHP